MSASVTLMRGSAGIGLMFDLYYPGVLSLGLEWCLLCRSWCGVLFVVRSTSLSSHFTWCPVSVRVVFGARRSVLVVSSGREALWSSSFVSISVPRGSRTPSSSW